MYILYTLIKYYLIFFSFKESSPVFIEEFSQKYFSKQSFTLVSKLPDEVKETSGLANFHNYLITHNDANNKNLLYILNKETGNIKTRIKVAGAENVDWEDLAESNEHIFIADIGNNDGNRKNLKIYKLKKSDISINEGAQLVPEGKIEFSYPDQNNFTSKKNHNFDGEALIYLNNFLYIFTKNRNGDISNVYKIPATPGPQKARLIDKLEFSGNITGAALSPSGKILALVGYNKNSDCFVYLIHDFKDDIYSSGKKNKINLGPFKQLGQTEGIVFEDENNLIISSEKIKNVEARLYKMKIQMN